MTRNRFLSRGLLLAVSLSAACVWAQTSTPPAAPVKVDAAWARATVQGQQGTGAFMNLTATQATRLVSISTPVAGVAELHEMKMEGDVMKMRALPGLDLPAGKTVQLKPGSYHLMLMDLKRPLAKDSSVPLTLRFVDAKGATSQLEVAVPVALTAPAGAVAAAPSHGGPHGAHKH